MAALVAVVCSCLKLATHPCVYVRLHRNSLYNPMDKAQSRLVVDQKGLGMHT